MTVEVMARYFVISLAVLSAGCSDILTPFDLVSEYSRSHSPLQRPVTNPASVLDVKVGFNLLGIENLDETKQQLTTTAWFYFVWTMEGLIWDEAKFQNISRVHAKTSDIFLPDLVISNNVNNYGRLSWGDLPVTIWSNGTVEWYAVDLRTTSCKVDVTRFPFDHQRCTIRLAQWFTFTSEVNYTFHDTPFTFVMYKENGEWEMLDHYNHIEYTYNGTYQILVFGLLLGRRRAYYILTAVLPACVLSALNLLVFHVPPGSGEKLTLCVSILLSYAVYLTSINSLLPSVSDHVALFSVYLNCMFCLKALSVAATVFVLHLQSAQPASGIRILLSNRLSWKEKSPYLTNLSDANNSSKETEAVWSDTVKKTDRVLFWVFFFICITLTLGFFTACTL